MPNVGAVLKNEITRLSNKEARANVGAVRTGVAAQRKQIAALKAQIHQLGRDIAMLRSASNGRAKPADTQGEGTKVRFTAKSLKSLRSRLGLSAEEFGKLLEVGGQTIYNWESQKTSPRAAQLPAIAGLRNIGKKEARQRLTPTTEAE